MLTLAIALILFGMVLAHIGHQKRQEELKEKKSFVVLITTLFLIYLFPGATLMIIGTILLALFFGGVHF